MFTVADDGELATVTIIDDEGEELRLILDTLQLMKKLILYYMQHIMYIII